MKTFFRITITAFFIFSFVPNTSALEAQEKTGEDAVAARYVAYIMEAVGAGRNEEAKEFLLRTADYANVSSDLSYLLALVISRMGGNQNEVLAAVRLAITTGRFNVYSSSDARLLEARTLLNLKNYEEAMRALSLQGDSESVIQLRLIALSYLNDVHGFRRLAEDAITRYPRNTVFLRLLFKYYSGENYFADNVYDTHPLYPSQDDRNLVDTALKRLPLLLPIDPDLAYIAAPFISDIEYARRIITSWRSVRAAPIPIESLPISLDLGVISEDVAIYELFSPQVAPKDRIVDKNIIEKVFNLLRTDTSRTAFIKDLLIFSGTITEDLNADGINEITAVYNYGMISTWRYDKTQNGEADYIVQFSAGDPISCSLFTTRTNLAGGKQMQLVINWEKYPSVFDVILDTGIGSPYHLYFKPQDFYYQVLEFVYLCEPQSLLYPQVNQKNSLVSEHSLFTAAYLVERESIEFPGAIEKIDCKNGIKILSKEYIDGKLISYTEYSSGVPIMQTVDIDLDGRMDTRRYFKKISYSEDLNISNYKKATPYEIERIESDFSGDGIF